MKMEYGHRCHGISAWQLTTFLTLANSSHVRRCIPDAGMYPRTWLLVHTVVASQIPCWRTSFDRVEFYPICRNSTASLIFWLSDKVRHNLPPLNTLGWKLVLAIYYPCKMMVWCKPDSKEYLMSWVGILMARLINERMDPTATLGLVAFLKCCMMCWPLEPVHLDHFWQLLTYMSKSVSKSFQKLYRAYLYRQVSHG